MRKTFFSPLRKEWPFAVSALSCVAFLLWGGSLLADLSRPLWLTFIFIWLFAAMLVSAISVVSHADHLALQVGEPGGTLILTIAVTFVEVMAISAAMVHSANPTLTRDTLFA